MVVYFYASAEGHAIKPPRAEVYEEEWFEWGRLPE